MRRATHSRAALRLSHFTASAGTKVIAGAIFSGLFSGVFQLLQRTPLAEPAVWRECVVWSAIPFWDGWTLPYLSLFPLIGLAWFAQPDWRELRRYLTAMFAAAFVGWVTFLFYPTASARPSLFGTSWIYQWLVAVDPPTNSFPALHSAFATVAATALVHGATTVTRGWKVFAWLWVALIATATVLLRQHTGFDVLAGFVVGGLVALFYRRSFAAREIEVSVGEPADEPNVVRARRG